MLNYSRLSNHSKNRSPHRFPTTNHSLALSYQRMINQPLKRHSMISRSLMHRFLTNHSTESAHQPKDIEEYINSLTWLAADVPNTHIADAYRVLLVEREYFQKICIDMRLVFPSTLVDILQLDSPLLFGGFRSLDTEASREKVWGIYTVLMEKAGDKPKLYVGSGNSSEGEKVFTI